MNNQMKDKLQLMYDKDDEFKKMVDKQGGIDKVAKTIEDLSEAFEEIKSVLIKAFRNIKEEMVRFYNDNELLINKMYIESLLDEKLERENLIDELVTENKYLKRYKDIVEEIKDENNKDCWGC